MRKNSQLAMTVSLMAFTAFTSAPVSALTLDELRHEPNLTPQRFGSHFSQFKFEFRDEVQAPDVFLATRSGDCDDFSILAAMVLKERGYTPRLVAVRMPGMVHV